MHPRTPPRTPRHLRPLFHDQAASVSELLQRKTLALAAGAGGLLPAVPPPASGLEFGRLASSGACCGYVAVTDYTGIGDVLWAGLKRRERALEKVAPRPLALGSSDGHPAGCEIALRRRGHGYGRGLRRC